MFKIMSFSKYKSLTRYVVDLEEKYKVLKEFNENMEKEIKRLEKKLRDYELKGVKIKAEDEFMEYEPVNDLDLRLELAVFNDEVTNKVVMEG